MIDLTAGDVAAATGGRLCAVDADTAIGSVVADSRAVASGSLFVAIRGEHVDGHDFAASAVASGAAAVLAARPLVDASGLGVPSIVVDDPVAALGQLAAWVRRERLTCTVVGITGSSGKTGTKDLVAAVLERLGPTVCPAGSLNTEVGLPLTILSADDSTRYLVLEMGMRGEGHIAYLVGLAQPDVGVVINVGSAHLGMLGSREAIARAKGELVAGLTADGLAVLNGDDPLVRAMADDTPARIVTFGEAAHCDVRAVGIRLDARARATFDLVTSDGSAPVSLQYSGEHYASNSLAAAAVGIGLGASVADVALALTDARPRSRWRMEVTTTASGLTVVNDAYNANPESVRAALKSLAAMARGRRTWAVLGEMRELGDDSVAEHDAIGRLAVRLDISRLVCVGEGTRVMHLGASNEGSWGDESVHVADADEAITLLLEHAAPGDVVLVKASRSVGLERVALALIEREEAGA